MTNLMQIFLFYLLTKWYLKIITPRYVVIWHMKKNPQVRGQGLASFTLINAQMLAYNNNYKENKLQYGIKEVFYNGRGLAKKLAHEATYNGPI